MSLHLLYLQTGLLYDASPTGDNARPAIIPYIHADSDAIAYIKNFDFSAEAALVMRDFGLRSKQADLVVEEFRKLWILARLHQVKIAVANPIIAAMWLYFYNRDTALYNAWFAWPLFGQRMDPLCPDSQVLCFNDFRLDALMNFILGYKLVFGLDHLPRFWGFDQANAHVSFVECIINPD